MACPAKAGLLGGFVGVGKPRGFWVVCSRGAHARAWIPGPIGVVLVGSMISAVIGVVLVRRCDERKRDGNGSL